MLRLGEDEAPHDSSEVVYKLSHCCYPYSVNAELSLCSSPSWSGELTTRAEAMGLPEPRHPEDSLLF